MRRHVLAPAIVFSTAVCFAALAGAQETASRPTSTISIEKCQVHVIDRSLLAAERHGVIDIISVREGAVVKADTELVRLRDDIARARLDVVSARAANDIEVRYSRVLSDTAKANYDAGLDLEKKNAISTFQLRQRRLEFERGALSIEQAEVNQRLAGLEAIQAQAELRAHSLVAPFDGTVTRLLKHRGEAVQIGDPVLELVNTQRVQVEGYGRLDDLWDVRPGTRVRVQLDAPQLARYGVADRVFEGELVLVDVVVQPVTEKVRVVADVTNVNNILRDGLKAWMHIDTASSPRVTPTSTPGN